MRHFPIFLSLDDQRVVVSGAQACAIAKLRLLLKTAARIDVYGANPAPQVQCWADQGKLTLTSRALTQDDIADATLFYAANDNTAEDARVAGIARAAGILVNVVDDLDASQFITPAIVDRSPVTIAIGTQGAAPVLARQIKQQLEETLPSSLGALARIGQSFRTTAQKLPSGFARREFWTQFYSQRGIDAYAKGGAPAALAFLNTLFSQTQNKAPKTGHIWLLGTGSGEADLLSLKARNALHDADTVVYDAQTTNEILELARREADIYSAQSITADALIQQAQTGKQIVYLQASRDDLSAALKASTIPYTDIHAAVVAPTQPYRHDNNNTQPTNKPKTEQA